MLPRFHIAEQAELPTSSAPVPPNPSTLHKF